MKRNSKRKNIILLSISILSFICFILLSIYISFNKYNSLDDTIMNFFYDIRGNKKGIIFYIFRIFTEFGGTIFLIFFNGLIMLFTKGDKRFLISMLGSLFAIILFFAFKETISRPRPDVDLMWHYQKTKSFPSGHSLLSTFVYSFFLFILLDLSIKKNKKILIYVITITLLLIIYISRMILGCHYLTDIIGGILLGLSLSFIAMFIFNITNKDIYLF